MSEQNGEKGLVIEGGVFVMNTIQRVAHHVVDQVQISV